MAVEEIAVLVGLTGHLLRLFLFGGLRHGPAHVAVVPQSIEMLELDRFTVVPAHRLDVCDPYPADREDVAMSKRIDKQSGIGVSSKPKDLFTKGNKKLGPSTFAFNLPVFQTCPGKSKACEKACYADKGNFRWPHVRKRSQSNLAASKRPTFVQRAVDELRRRKAKKVRPHCSGDFYCAEYVRKWRAIAAALPDVKFWMYTRSWRVPEILEELKCLVELPNVELWFSADNDTGVPPRVERVRVCWLYEDDSKPPVDLIFPTKQTGRIRAKRIGSAMVCPTYNGTLAGEKTTCETCGFCWNAPAEKPGLLQIGQPVNDHPHAAT